VTTLGTNWGQAGDITAIFAANITAILPPFYRHYLLHSLRIILIHDGSKERSLLGKASKPNVGTSIQQ